MEGTGNNIRMAKGQARHAGLLSEPSWFASGALQWISSEAKRPAFLNCGTCVIYIPVTCSRPGQSAPLTLDLLSHEKKKPLEFEPLHVGLHSQPQPRRASPRCVLMGSQALGGAGKLGTLPLMGAPGGGGE